MLRELMVQCGHFCLPGVNFLQWLDLGLRHKHQYI